MLSRRTPPPDQVKASQSSPGPVRPAAAERGRKLKTSSSSRPTPRSLRWVVRNLVLPSGTHNRFPIALQPEPGRFGFHRDENRSVRGCGLSDRSPDGRPLLTHVRGADAFRRKRQRASTQTA